MRKDTGSAKMIIKLMKRLSDAQGWHELSGYYLQTVVVNMITNKPNEKPGDSFQNTEIIVSFEYFPYKCRSVDVCELSRLSDRPTLSGGVIKA